MGMIDMLKDYQLELNKFDSNYSNLISNPLGKVLLDQWTVVTNTWWFKFFSLFDKRFKRRLDKAEETKKKPDEEISTYRIVTAAGVSIVERRPSDPIICACGGRFICVEEEYTVDYSKLITHIWQCNRCHGKISVGRYHRFGLIHDNWQKIADRQKDSLKN